MQGWDSWLPPLGQGRPRSGTQHRRPSASGLQKPGAWGGADKGEPPVSHTRERHTWPFPCLRVRTSLGSQRFLASVTQRVPRPSCRHTRGPDRAPARLRKRTGGLRAALSSADGVVASRRAGGGRRGPPKLPPATPPFLPGGGHETLNVIRTLKLNKRANP